LLLAVTYKMSSNPEVFYISKEKFRSNLSKHTVVY